MDSDWTHNVFTDLNSPSGAVERPRAKLDRRRCLGANLFMEKKLIKPQRKRIVLRFQVKPKWKHINAADAFLRS